MKHTSSLLLILAFAIPSFLIGRLFSSSQERESPFIIQRPSTQFPDSEEFFLPGSRITFHVPNGFYLSDAKMNISPEPSGEGLVCLQHTLSTRWQNVLFMSLANSTHPCIAETSFPNASNMLTAQQSFTELCDDLNYSECSLFSPGEDWMAVRAFTYVPEYIDPQNYPGSLAYFYALYNPAQQREYDIVVLTLSPQTASIRPEEYDGTITELSIDLPQDHPLYYFQQDMKTLDTLIEQIVFDTSRRSSG